MNDALFRVDEVDDGVALAVEFLEGMSELIGGHDSAVPGIILDDGEDVVLGHDEDALRRRA